VSDLPPYNETTGALKKLLELDMGVELLGAILGLDPEVWIRCQGRPDECGVACTENTCPLRTNRLQEVGEMVVMLLEEFRWHRAWAEELEASRAVPKGTLERVELRVQRSRLQERLAEALKDNEALTGVQVLQERFAFRISEIRANILTIDAKLGVPRGPPE
jgi:hypothetical protein